MSSFIIHLFVVSFFDVFRFSLELIRFRSGAKSKELTDEDLYKEMGPSVFANAADGDGGAEKRKRDSAKRKAAVEKVLAQDAENLDV